MHGKQKKLQKLNRRNAPAAISDGAGIEGEEMGRREQLKVKYSYFKQIRSAAIKRKVVTLPDPVLETVVKFVACWC